MKSGIAYLNCGTSCLPRLLVSISSLRRFYSGEITIVYFGTEGVDICKAISKEYKVKIIQLKELSGKNSHFLEKTRMHKYVDYEDTLFLDSDTLIMSDISELFREIEESEFVVPAFSDWKMNSKTICKRTSHWQDYFPDLYKKLIRSDWPSINVGVFGFSKDSELMLNWHGVAEKCKSSFIPDECACHLLLHKYKHKIISNIYNYSCSKDHSLIKDAKIIHYHGKKHVRMNDNGFLLFHSELWVDHFIQLYLKNACDIKGWVEKCNDRRVCGLVDKINGI